LNICCAICNDLGHTNERQAGAAPAKAGSDFLVTSIEPKLGLARVPGSGEHEAGH
jgi:hypothetical protein